MASRLYLINFSMNRILAGFGQTENAFPLKSSGATTFVMNGLQLLSTRGTTVTTQLTDTVLGPTAGVDTGITGIAQPGVWLSPPIDADVTISGTITCNIWASETAMTNNAAMNARIWKVSSEGVITLLGTSTNTVELGTSSSVNVFTITPTSTALNKGDRIFLVLFIDDSAAATMAAVANGVSVFASGPTAGASGDSYIEFTETFGYQETAPAGTIIYLTGTASAVSTASVDLEAWTSRGGAVQSAITNSAAGLTAPIQMTDAAGGTVVDWFTRPLQATTLSGTVLCNLRALISSASSNNFAAVVEIAVVEGDGSSPTIWCKSKSYNGWTTTSEAQLTQYLASGDDLAISDGQRIRIRLYIDDGLQSTNAGVMTAGRTVTFRYAGTSGGGSGDSFLQFTGTLDEFVGGSSGVEPPPIRKVLQAVQRAAYF